MIVYAGRTRTAPLHILHTQSDPRAYGGVNGGRIRYGGARLDRPPSCYCAGVLGREFSGRKGGLDAQRPHENGGWREPPSQIDGEAWYSSGTGTTIVL